MHSEPKREYVDYPGETIRSGGDTRRVPHLAYANSLVLALAPLVCTSACEQDPPGSGTRAGVGFGLAFLNDLDGDGCDEYALGVRFSYNRQFVQVLSGKDGRVLRQIPPEGLGEAWGLSLANVGDQDADGVDDLLVTNGSWKARSVHVMSSATGTFVWSRPAQPFETAFRTCTAGDVNRDGHVDVALLVDIPVAPEAAPAHDEPSPLAEGRLLRQGFFGARDLLVPHRPEESADQRVEPTPVVKHLSILSGVDGTELRHAYVPRGERIIALGDIDGDGTCELALTTESGIVDVRTTFGEPVHEIHPPFRVTRFSGAVANAGDHDGDGVDDIAVGYPHRDGPFREPGHVLIVSGATGERLGDLRDSVDFGGFGRTLASVGDLDGDRCPDLIVGRYTNFVMGTVHFASGAELVTRTCEGVPDWPNVAYALASGGDVDGDGVLDVLVGNYSEGQPYTGSVLVVSGRTRAVIRSHAHTTIEEMSSAR